MPEDSPIPPQHSSRFWLFAPLVLLGLVAAAWSAAWFVIRNETVRALDQWIVREAAASRQWTCPNRSVGGFPFRIEVGCDSLALQSPDLRLTLGAVTALAQVYRPRHVIVEATGPLRAENGAIALDGSWRLLEASVRSTREGLQRASLVIDGPDVRLTGLPPGELLLRGQGLETHVRPDPARAANESAYDVSFALTGAALPGLDALAGGAEPADLDVQLTFTQARDIMARSLVDGLERWRQSGGRIEVTTMRLSKGPRGAEGRGDFSLDDAHRPQGRAELATAGLEGLLGTLLGAPNSATNALLGALTGRPSGPQTPAATGGGDGKPRLKPLPPLRIEGGRIYLGPIALPGLRVAPLY